jgi:hypothetical protein
MTLTCVEIGTPGGKTLEVSKGGQSGMDIKLSATYKEENGKFYVWKDPSGDEKEGNGALSRLIKTSWGTCCFAMNPRMS